MKISLSALADTGRVERVAVRSLDCNLYRAEAWIAGERRVITDDAGQALCGRSLSQVKDRLAGLDIAEFVLIHESAYDEMIGLPAGVRGDNTLEVGLAVAAAAGAVPGESGES